MLNELDLRTLWKELDAYEKELSVEADSLQDVWVKIAELKEACHNEQTRLLGEPELEFLDDETLISFNIGGQIFEATVSCLTRDPFSLLAVCCRRDCPLPRTLDGFYFFDRDWWIFRHLLAFLRSNVLPSDLDTLKELYSEASFYRLESLQRAIEEIPVSEVSAKTVGVN